MLNDLAKAQLTGFYEDLVHDEAVTISLALLRDYIGADAVAEIKALRDDLAEAKKEAKNGLGLSSGAVGYWKQFQKLRRQADIVSARPGADKREGEFGRKAEKLRDDFYKLVPEREHGLFLIHDPEKNEADWDNRWDYLEHRPPLLKHSASVAFPIDKPMNYAQIHVISRFIEPPCVAQSPVQQAKENTLRETLMRHVDPDRRPVRVLRMEAGDEDR